jgi:hypothetical protein
MEPADGAQCRQADARRHGGARRLRGVPSALKSRAEFLRHKIELYWPNLHWPNLRKGFDAGTAADYLRETTKVEAELAVID